MHPAQSQCRVPHSGITCGELHTAGYHDRLTLAACPPPCRLGLPPTPEVMAEWPLSQRLQSFVTYLAGTEAAGTETGAKADRLRDLAAAAEGVTQSPTKALAAAASDELGEALDKQFGSGIRDHAIFNEHARHFEREYMEDMKLLGIRPPDVVTRVTECVPSLHFTSSATDRRCTCCAFPL